MAKSRAPRGVFGERVTQRTPDRSSFTPPVFGAQWERKNTRAGSWQGFDNPPPDDTPAVVSDPTVNVAPVIGATPDVTPAVWSSGASDTQRWEMADTDAGPWSTVSDMPDIDTPYTDQTFGKVLRWVEAQGGVTAESAATDPVAFDPLTIPGLVRWWDAQDTTTLFEDSAGATPAADNNDVIGKWSDKSASAAHATQATTANKPLLKTAGVNGRAAIQFDGSDDFLDFTSLAMTNFTIIVVYQLTAISAGLHYILASLNQGVYAGGTAGGFNGYGAIAGGQNREASEEPLTVGIVAFQNAKLFRNNIEATYGKTGTLTGLTISRIGGRADNSLYHLGPICEILISGSVLNATWLDIIDRYCKAKWGIS